MTEQTGRATPFTVTAPASKSLSHRYLIGAGLAAGKSVLRHTLDSADVRATAEILRSLGVGIDAASSAGGDLLVCGLRGPVAGGRGHPLPCDVGESGSTCRLMCAVLATGSGLFRISGHGRMHDRPVGELCRALVSLGAGVVYEGKPGCPPLILQAQGLNPRLVHGPLPVVMDDSSQYFSALLLAAPLCPSPLTLMLAGNKAISWPYVGLTLQVLDDFGVDFCVDVRSAPDAAWHGCAGKSWRKLKDVLPGCLRVTVIPGCYRAGSFVVEGDWSGASYFLAAGALGKRPVRVRGLRMDSLQGDRAMLDILRAMGAAIDVGDDAVTVYPSSLHGIDLDMGNCPDIVPTVAVLAAFARGSTRIRNVAHLRLKESDRIAAPVEELSRIGVTVDELSDGLLVSGNNYGNCGPGRPAPPYLPEGVGLSAHGDHRMAMALALLELINPRLSVHDLLDEPQVVDKSFPDFWEKWRLLL